MNLLSSSEKTINWLNSESNHHIPEDYDDLESVTSSIIESSKVDSSDSESGEEQQLGVISSHDNTATLNLNRKQNYTDITEIPNYNNFLNLSSVQNQLHQLAPIPTYSNVSISNSTNVRLGNIIKIKGNLNINVINNNNDEVTETQDQEDQLNNKSHIPTTNENTEVPPQQRTESNIYRPACLIISRRRWLAMDPLNEYKYIRTPVDLVIISHTATASSMDQPGNIGIIRDMQTLHIETQGWNDIIHNFLIGCDGNVYEGRGWGVAGDHTVEFNNISISIAFVGSFMKKLPTDRALKACKNLLKRGLVEEHLSKDYTLFGQPKCSTHDITGTKLYEEIQKWEHFKDKYKYKDETVDKIKGE